MLIKKSPQLNLRRKHDLPINYSNIKVDSVLDMKERSSLLKERVVEGYGVIWNSKNDHSEVFVKGCFAKSINDLGPDSSSPYKIKLRDRHGKSVSLFEEIKEDDIGLYFKSVPLDRVQWADDLLEQLSTGTLNNFSIGFKHMWDRIELDEEDDTMINLEAQLFEISVVDIPSDMSTYSIRSYGDEILVVKEIEEFIVSLPKKRQLEARKIFTRCMSPISEAPTSYRSKSPEAITPPKRMVLNLDYLISKL